MFIARHWVEKNLIDADLKDNQNKPVEFLIGGGTTTLYGDGSTSIQVSGNTVVVPLSSSSSGFGFTAGQITYDTVVQDSTNANKEMVFMHGPTVYVVDESVTPGPLQWTGTAITVALKPQ